MNHFEDLHLSPPPPAYSEQAFDQKISLATQLSLATPESQPEHEEDAWEVWDDSAFEAAAAKLKDLSLQGPDGARASGETSGQSSSGGVNAGIQPLRIHKKNLSNGGSSVPSGKQTPSWLVEAEIIQLGPSGSSAPTVPVAPIYTPSIPSDSTSPTSGLSPTTLPNPCASREWGAASPVPTLPDPRVNQEDQPDGSSSAPPTSAEGSLPPPPFSSNGEDQPFNPYELLTPQPAPGPVSPDFQSSTAPTSMPVPTQSNPATSFSNLTAVDQLHLPIPDTENDVSTYSSPSNTRNSMPANTQVRYSQYNLPNQFSPVPSQSRTANVYRNSMMSLQSTAIPQVNVDLSTAYGKRPTATIFNEPQPPQVFDPAAFYNSAVSAHLKSPYSKQPVNSMEQRRQSHQPLTAAALYRLQQATQNTPNRYSRLPPVSAPSQNPYNPTLQNPLIRSPTPTYPTGNANSRPHVLVAANEGYQGHQSSVPHSVARGQVPWTDHNIYR